MRFLFSSRPNLRSEVLGISQNLNQPYLRLLERVSHARQLTRLLLYFSKQSKVETHSRFFCFSLRVLGKSASLNTRSQGKWPTPGDLLVVRVVPEFGCLAPFLGQPLKSFP